VKKFNPLKKISFASLHTGFDFFEKKRRVHWGSKEKKTKRLL